jgi:hypothetical protein
MWWDARHDTDATVSGRCLQREGNVVQVVVKVWRTVVFLEAKVPANNYSVRHQEINTKEKCGYLVKKKQQKTN